MHSPFIPARGALLALALTFGPSVLAQEGGAEPLQDAKTAGSGNRSSRSERIVNGVPVPPGFATWQVALVFSGYPTAQGQFCGGSLISPRWVLTAAHCVDKGTQAKDIEIYAGSINLNSGGKRYALANDPYMHKDYDPTTKNNDIALLKLSTDVTVAQPISLMTPSQEEQFARPKYMSIVTGWGRTTEGGPSSARLLMTTVPIVARSECNEADSYGGAITNNMICAGEATKDSCQGDSGGPLFVSDREDGHVLAGVVSWGHGCARLKKYGVYTRVPNYLDWIRTTMTGKN